MVKFFGLAAKYPCVEYLVKLGFSNLVENKISGFETYRAVNFRGSSLEKVLRLSKTEIKQLRNEEVEITALLLHSYHYHKKMGIDLNFKQAHQIRDLTFENNQNYFKTTGVSHSIVQSTRYVLKQLSRPDADKWYSSGSSVLHEWVDYLNDCKKLGMDMDSSAVVYPNDLHKTHMKTTEKIKYKEDKTINIQIAKRIDQLVEKYSLEYSYNFV